MTTLRTENKPISKVLFALTGIWASQCNGPSTTTGTDVPVVMNDAARVDGADVTQADHGTIPIDGSHVPPDSGPSTDAGPIGDGSTHQGSSGCDPLTIAAGAMVEGSRADTFTWSDSDCHPRVASLIRNDATDAYGEHGGYLRAISYQSAGTARNIHGTGSNGWQGFGYIINHYADTASETQGIGGTYRTALAGRHHAIHEFHWRITPGGNVDVTAQWFFATGRSHPLFIITFDSTPAGPGVVNADTRAPYGDLAWDNGAGGDVSGVSWGDHYRFTTTGNGPVTPHSPWDYSQTNTIPFAMEWSNATDSEMGLVATLSWDTHTAGGDYGGGLISNSWGHTGSDLLTDISDWDWPYQLNQYELPYVTGSHRVAWGANYGAVGSNSYSAFGHTLSGYPYQSYTVSVVLGTHTNSAVAAQVSEVDALQHVVLTATRGIIATDGIAGIARTDRVTYTPAGFDPIFAAWTIDADTNAATLRFNTMGASVKNPLIAVRNYMATTAPTTVTYGGRALTADTDYFATVDTSSHRLWLTLNATVSGNGEIAIQ